MDRNFEAIMKKFLEYYQSQEEEVFVKEFMTLKSYSQKYKETNRYPSPTGLLPINKKKNRFKDILPYEHTRVELHPIEGCEGSDYINANYIQGADGEINYIASQGPLPTTVNDFWRMLWYHNIEIVVMACREVEMGKNKCERYWPPVHQSTNYGAIKVTTSSEENMSNDFVVRDFTAECLGETQVIRQYHYNAWPDHGKPNSPDPIICMIELMNDYRKNKEIPIVIHCSAGCGRTGTMIGIDIAKIQLSAKNVSPDFSVFTIVEKMRQQRPAMVQAKDQYIFVYMAIAELAQRSIGMNPTLPPKPVARAAVPTGKSYINIDIDDPVPKSPSTSPTSTSHNGSTSSLSSANSENHLYQNVNSRPPLPSHKHLGTGEGTDSGSTATKELPPAVTRRQGSSNNGSSDAPKEVPPVTRRPGSSNGNGNGSGSDAPKEVPPVTTRRPGSTNSNGSDTPKEVPPVTTRRPEVKQRSTSNIIDSSATTSEKKLSAVVGVERPNQAPSPKPRGRRNHKPNDNNGAAPTPLPVLPTTTAGSVKAPPPIASRPGAKQKQDSLTLQQEIRPKTPDSVGSGGGAISQQRPVLPPAHTTMPHKPHPSNGRASPLPPTPFSRASPPTTDAPPLPPPVPMEVDSTYSFVDSDLIDTRPEIVVVGSGVDDNPPAPPSRESPAKKSNISITDTFKDMLDEDIFDTVETLKPLPSPTRSTSNISSRPLPSIPPTQSLDETPPEVPTRTDARLELVAPTYDIPNNLITSIDDDEEEEDVNGPSSFTDNLDYEQPTPLSIPVGGGKSNSQSLGQKKPVPPPVVASSSTAASIATMNRSPQRNTNSTSLLSNKIGSFFQQRKSKKKRDFDMSSEDLTSPGNNGVKPSTSSSSSTSVSTVDSSRAKRTSPSISSLNDERYRFPGSLGFGVRVERPAGPRDEPLHWKANLPPCAIRVT